MAINPSELKNIPNGTTPQTCYKRILEWHRKNGLQLIQEKLKQHDQYKADYQTYIASLEINKFDPRLFKEQIMGLLEWAYHERDPYGIKLGAYAHYASERLQSDHIYKHKPTYGNLKMPKNKGKKPTRRWLGKFEARVLPRATKQVSKDLSRDDLVFLYEERQKDDRMVADAIGYIEKKDGIREPYVVIEVKTHIRKTYAVDQLKALMKTFQTKFGVLTDGVAYIYFEKKKDAVLRFTPKGSKEELDIKELENVIWQMRDVCRETHQFSDDIIVEVLAYKKYVESEHPDEWLHIRNSLAHDHFSRDLFRHAEIHTNNGDIIDLSIFENKKFSVISRELQSLLMLADNISFSSMSKKMSDHLLRILRNAPSMFRHAPVSLKRELVEACTSLLKDQQEVLITTNGTGEIAEDLLKAKPSDRTVLTYDPYYNDLALLLAYLGNVSYDLIDQDYIYMHSIKKRSYDAIVALPPFGVKIEKQHIGEKLPVEVTDTESAHILKALLELKEDGVLLAVVSKVWLFKSGSVKKAREYLVQQGLLEAVFDLRPGTFKNTMIGGALLVISKRNKENILFGRDSSSNDTNDSKTKSWIENAHQALNKFRENNQVLNKSYSSVPIEDIQDQDYDLSPEKYDQTLKEKERETENTLRDKGAEIHALSQISDIFLGSNIPSKQRGEGDISFIRIGDIIDRAANLENADRVPFSAINEQNILRKGDILISISGTIGKIGIYDDDRPAVASSGLAVIRSRDINSYYLMDALESQYVSEQFSKLASGSFISRLNKVALSSLKVPIYPLRLKEEKYEEAQEIRRMIKEKEKDLAELKDKLRNII